MERSGRSLFAAILLKSNLLLLCRFAPTVHGNAGLFAYYETPIEGLGGRGPSNWRNLIIPNNECGGSGQATGFGQSPVPIPHRTKDKCDTDLSGYIFEAGTCAWEDMSFRILNNGVIIGAKPTSDCVFGRMKIPGVDNFFDALQFHIHTSSEHSVGGKYYPNELHVVHREENGNSFAVFGTFIDVDDGLVEHEVFERFLQGWEAVARQTDQFCASNPNGSGNFTANSVLTSRQMRMECPTVGSKFTEEVKLVGADETDGGGAPSTGDEPGDIDTIDSITLDSLPPLETIDSPPSGARVHNFYDDFHADDFGIYSYRGGLTTPPCSEVVHWNLLDAPMIISPPQLGRLNELILCFTEPSTCRHATIANEFGSTNRPPQPLNGRTVLHRCLGGPSVGATGVPLPPTVAAWSSPPRRQPHIAILYPWFTVVLGLIVFYILSRYVHVLPFTAIMFLLGTFMGIGIVVFENTDQLSASIRMWENINSELLLLIFLPGLLFRDSFGLNVHLFGKSIGQCLIMAFPMVLAGTCLLALVGYYILPYGWSWSLAMTFGSILSATDPVAVSALLNEVGAPPRLKTHISGESLLNDGSAIVFYTIFASQFLFDLGIPGLGQDIDVATGFALFFRMSLGAVAVGFAFGLGLIGILFIFKRRFNAEENIVQVTATIALAYLTYYVADVICGTSGVIAVVVCGILTKAFGSTMINDPVMMDKFWVLVEHLLNTVLFALGGVVWGTVISNSDKTRSETFSGTDWGYLFLLYVLMMVIRFFLVFAFFPVISRIGLKSDWKESVFLSFGGLRGAVGIALAISLDNELNFDTLPGDPRRNLTSQLFGMTGGVAFMTLFINGSLSGPLLRKLGLAESSEMRSMIVERYRHSMMLHALDYLLKLLGETRFYNVDFGLVRHHVPFMKEMTEEELKMAVKRNKGAQPAHEYKEPNLSTFRSFLRTESVLELAQLVKVSPSERLKSLVRISSVVAMPTEVPAELESFQEKIPQEEVVEVRKIFIELLRNAYHQQIEKGEIDVRAGFLVFVLTASLEITDDSVSKGGPLNDWEVCQEMSKKKLKDIIDRGQHDLKAIGTQARRLGVHVGHLKTSVQTESSESEYKKLVATVHRAAAFIQAHKLAQIAFKGEFCNNRTLSAAERCVLDESNQQILAAEDTIQAENPGSVEDILSHLLCSIILNNAARFIGDYVERGLLKETEGEEYIEEIEHELTKIDECPGGKVCKKHKSYQESSARMIVSRSSGHLSSRNSEKSLNSLPAIMESKVSKESKGGEEVSGITKSDSFYDADFADGYGPPDTRVVEKTDTAGVVKEDDIMEEEDMF